MLDLFNEGYKAQRVYVAERISNNKNRELYNRTSQEVLDLLAFNHVININDLELILHHKKQTLINIDFPISFLYEPRKYHLLAIDQALELVKSLRKRFHV